ncbi:MAG TPA: hypothetical protein VFI47_19160 [Acidimicrobiales bacterium]|nr:hypothetical protein [Acidimicrobiales bacterium]
MGPLTYDQVQQFPADGLRYELVDGEPLVDPAVPSLRVERLAGGRFVEVATAEGADRVRIEEPFPVDVAPSGLVP